MATAWNFQWENRGEVTSECLPQNSAMNLLKLQETCSGTVTPTEGCFEKMHTYRFWNINWLQKSKSYRYYSERKYLSGRHLFLKLCSVSMQKHVLTLFQTQNNRISRNFRHLPVLVILMLWVTRCYMSKGKLFELYS